MGLPTALLVLDKVGVLFARRAAGTTGNATFSPVVSTVHGSRALSPLPCPGGPAVSPSFLLPCQGLEDTLCAGCPTWDTSRPAPVSPVSPSVTLRLHLPAPAAEGAASSRRGGPHPCDSPSGLGSSQLVLVSLTSKCGASPGPCQPLRLAPPSTHGPHHGADLAPLPSHSSITNSSWKLCPPTPADSDFHPACMQWHRPAVPRLRTGVRAPRVLARGVTWGPEQQGGGHPAPRVFSGHTRGGAPGAECAQGCHGSLQTRRLLLSSGRVALFLTYFVGRH